MISELPLFFFTALTGIGAGLYAVAAVFSKNRTASGWWLPLTVFILSGVGGLCSVLHLGHPELGLNALVQPGSGIAQEAYCVGWIMAFAMADLLLLKIRGKSPRALLIIGGLAGLSLMGVTSYAYVLSLGVGPWTNWSTWFLFAAGDLLMGAALLAVFENDLLANKAFIAVYLVLAACTLVGLVAAAGAFANTTSGTWPFIAGAIVAPVASAILLVVGKSAKMTPKGTASWMFVLCVVGLCIARYFFYAVCNY